MPTFLEMHKGIFFRAFDESMRNEIVCEPGINQEMFIRLYYLEMIITDPDRLIVM